MCDRCCPRQRRPKWDQQMETLDLSATKPLVNDRKFSVQYQSDTEINSGEDEDLDALKANLYYNVGFENDITEFKSCLEKAKILIKQNAQEKQSTKSKQTGEEDAFKRFLNEGDEPLLQAAARVPNLEAIKLLLDYGADVNVRNDINNVPLHLAAWGPKAGKPEYETVSLDRKPPEASELSANEDELKNEQVVDYFVSLGADPNAYDDGKQTPLHNAALRGNTGAARALLRCKNINVNMADSELQTPLHIACTYGYTKICEMLIKANAFVYLKDRLYCTPLHYASASGNCRIIELLLQSVQNENERTKFINMMGRDSETALSMAVINIREAAAKLLLERGADISTKYKRSNTILHIACSKGNMNILQILMDKGADINGKNVDFQTPLHTACADNNINIVECLLTRNADMEARDKRSCTPLLICFENEPSDENYSIIQMLIEHGANINVSNKSGATLVTSAAIMNNVKALEYLLKLKNGKSLVNSVDTQKNSALHYAAEYGNLDAFKCLIENGAVINVKNAVEETPFHTAVNNGCLDIVDNILDRDNTLSMITDLDSGYNTSLHNAATSGDCDIVTRLLSQFPNATEKSIVLEKRNGMYYTALDCAAIEGHEKVVEILLDNGAKVSGGGSYTGSALHEACKQGQTKVVKLLLDRGASADKLDINLVNCLEVAIDNNQIEVAKIIVDQENWKDVMKHSRTNSKCFPGCRSTPLREIIKTMPDLAEIILDKSVTVDKTGSIKTYDYELLDDVYSNWTNDYSSLTLAARQRYKEKDVDNGFDKNGTLRPNAKLYSKKLDEIKKNHPLMIMVSQDNERLLAHDIVSRLLNYKWKSYARHIYYAGLFMYILFITSLTYFAVNSIPYYNFDESFTTLPPDFCENETLTSLHSDVIPAAPFHVRIAQVIAGILSVLNILKELSQMYYRRKNYLEPQNLIEITLYICTLLFVISWDKCSFIYGYRLQDQWMFGVVAVILAWIDLILMVRQFPTLGIYVVMFTDVLRTFSKFFLVFFLFVIAFVSAFHMLFQNQGPFISFPRSIVKTLVMMVGELDYAGIFYAEEKAHYPNAAQIVFLIFAIVMTILIMNLLVGLAVDDIKTVQNKAMLKRLAMKVELALEIEYIAPECIRRKFMIARETVSADAPKPFLSRIFRFIFPKTESVASANAELFGDKTKDEDNQLREDVANLQKSVDELKSLISNIAARLPAAVDNTTNAETETADTVEPQV